VSSVGYVIGVVVDAKYVRVYVQGTSWDMYTVSSRAGLVLVELGVFFVLFVLGEEEVEE